MPEEPTATPEVQTIRQLVRLMQRYDLTAIDLGDGPGRIRLRRRGGEVAPTFAPAPAPTFAPAPAPHAETPVAAVASVAAPGPTIESPMVGTFYSSGSPDAPPYIAVGATVKPETIVCVIEAMKVFTDIPAGLAGRVVEVMVKSGQPVEYGQPMFRLAQD